MLFTDFFSEYFTFLLSFTFYSLFSSSPAAFTPVCTTELGQVSRLQKDFEALNTVVAGLSIDSVDANTKWINDINEYSSCDLQFPIICDEDYKVALAYGMLNQDHVINGKTVTARTVFFIGPDKKIRATLTYPASSGRNFKEIYRLLKSLQLTEQSQVATPANWKEGDKVVIIPSVSTEEAKKKFKNVEVVKPYLRLTEL